MIIRPCLGSAYYSNLVYKTYYGVKRKIRVYEKWENSHILEDQEAILENIKACIL